MTSPQRWATRIAAGLAALVVVGAGVGWWLIPSDAQLATRIAQTFEQRLGVGLKIGRLHWQLLPVPRIEVEDIATVQDEPITVRRLVLSPQLLPLLSRRIRVDELEVHGVLAPTASVRAFRGRFEALTANAKDGQSGWQPAEIPLGRLRFDDLTWSDRRDIQLAYDGDIVFDPQWRPRTAEIHRNAVTPPARLRLEREGDAERWQTFIDVAGGTWNGTTQLQTAADGKLLLTAQLAPRNIDIEVLMQAFGRSSPVAGKVSGQTELRSEAEQIGQLWGRLHTRTQFTVQPATLTRFDLQKAIRTAGTSRGGQTPLDQLTGTLDTQNTDDGMQLDYTNLKARSGVLTATGKARIVNRRLSGEAAVDIVDGVVGVPLKLGGTLSDPELSLTGGALTGAAVGTAVMPGVGTAIGARIGQQIERLFTDKEGAKRAAPKRPRP